MPQGHAEPSDLYDAPIPAEALRPNGAPTTDALAYLLDPDPTPDVHGVDVKTAQEWRVKNDDDAEWAMARVAEIAAERSALEVQVAAWRERLIAWFDYRDAGLSRRMEWFEAHLVAYARRRREEDPRAKTLDLPSGKVRSTARAARVAVEDPEAFLKWADTAERFDLFRVERKPEVSALRQALEVVNAGTADAPEWRVVDPATGEEVPGLGVAAPEVSYSVSPL